MRESIVQKGNCFVEEIKGAELRSRRGKVIYNIIITVTKLSNLIGYQLP